MLLLLVGPRGSGKTSVGRALARLRRASFVDLDDRVLARFPEPTIRAVWEVHGEAAWREGEVAELRRALEAARPGGGDVVALGGGTPMIPAARRLIDAARADRRARVVYLRCTPAVLASRLAADVGDRPSLTGGDVVAEIGAVLADRAPVYEGVADVVRDNDGHDAEATASAIARLEEVEPGS